MDPICFRIVKSHNKNCAGSSSIEFVLVFPWVILFVFSLLFVFLLSVGGNLLRFAAYKGSRAMSVYAEEGATLSTALIAPRTKILEVDSEKGFHIGRSPVGLLPSMETNVPIRFSLEGESIDLSQQTRRDKRNQHLMDNWIGICGPVRRYLGGKGGRYFLCDLN